MPRRSPGRLRKELEADAGRKRRKPRGLLGAKKRTDPMFPASITAEKRVRRLKRLQRRHKNKPEEIQRRRARGVKSQLQRQHLVEAIAVGFRGAVIPEKPNPNHDFFYETAGSKETRVRVKFSTKPENDQNLEIRVRIRADSGFWNNPNADKLVWVDSLGNVFMADGNNFRKFVKKDFKRRLSEERLRQEPGKVIDFNINTGVLKEEGVFVAKGTVPVPWAEKK